MRHPTWLSLSVIPLIGLVALTAQQPKTFKARLSPVPMDFAMQATIAGSGSVSAVLTGTKLAITGTFDGLKSPATIAQIHKSPVRGVRGPKGGYLLAREKRRITLSDICKALGDNEAIPSSTPLGNQVVVPVLKKIHGSLLEQLHTITMADLFEQASQNRIRKVAGERNDFTI